MSVSGPTTCKYILKPVESARMSFKKNLISLVQVLESYRGKDRFIRAATYVAMFMGGDGSTPAQKKWKTVSAEMAACRVILRLFDDPTMLLVNLKNGFGLKVSRNMGWDFLINV